jgi:pimeloyl-ACP methyl ester carboxylesterase
MQMVEHFVKVGGQPIHYIRGGTRREGSVPIVLVHGISGATDWWRNNLDFLSGVAEVYALDLPGFGESRAVNKPFRIDNEIETLGGWLAAVGVSRALLVGHSLGGYVVAALSARSPELSAGLVLVDPAIFPPGYSRWRLALGTLRGVFHLSLDFIPTLLKGSIAAGPVTILRAARDLLTRTILDELAKIRAPTLLIWGNKDTVVPVALSQSLIAAMPMPAAEPTLLRGGHVSMWDDPERFNEAVKRFLVGL